METRRNEPTITSNDLTVKKKKSMKFLPKTTLKTKNGDQDSDIVGIIIKNPQKLIAAIRQQAVPIRMAPNESTTVSKPIVKKTSIQNA